MKPSAPIPDLPGLSTGSHSIAVQVDGNPAALHATSAWLSKLATAENTLADDLTATVNASQHAWSGSAAEAFRQRARRARDNADTLHGTSSTIASAVDTFASEISAVKSQIAAAKGLARSAGYRVTANAIQFPMPLLNPAQGGTSGEITAMVSLARRQESTAHTNLRTALTKHKTFLESLVSSPTRPVSIGRSLFTQAASATRFVDNAREQAAIMRGAAILAEKADGATRQVAQSALFNGTPTSAFNQLVLRSNAALKYGVPNWVPLPEAGVTRDLAKSVLKPLSVSSGLITGAGVGLDIASGTPTDKAVVKGGASFAASAATSAIVEAAGLLLLGASPPGLVVLTASTIVGAGVSYHIDQTWQSPSDAATHGGGGGW